MLRYLKNRAKPIKGAIAAAITYVLLKVGLEADPELAATLAGLAFAAIVDLARPIFGESAESPKLNEQGRIEIDPGNRPVDLPDPRRR